MSFIIAHQEFLIGCFISALGIVVSIYLYLIAIKYRQIAYTLQSADISLENILNSNESVFPFNLPDSNVFMNLDSAIILVLCVVSAILAVPHVYNLFKPEPPKELLSNTLCEK